MSTTLVRTATAMKGCNVKSSPGVSLEEIVKTHNFDSRKLWGNQALLLVKTMRTKCAATSTRHVHVATRDTQRTPYAWNKYLGYISSSAFVVPVAKTTKNNLDKTIILGRAISADIRLVSPTVSRTHAYLHPPTERLGIWRIEDVSSMNGTYVNNLRIPLTTKAHIGASDEIRIGDIGMLFLDSHVLQNIIGYARKAWTSLDEGPEQIDIGFPEPEHTFLVTDATDTKML